MEQGNYQLVGTMLSPCRSVEAVDLTRRADRYLRQKAEIGIALPLSGEFQKYGEQILDGIRLRMEQYTSETGQGLIPLVYDTRGDNLEAARAIKHLSDGGATAAIGPLTSDAGAIASAALACADLPLIIPAASQGGLTELSGSSFQLQPNLEWQGLLMADFARMKLGADTTAIITPTSPENLRMARAFKKRFEDLGGIVLGVEYFRARETDFGQYVRDLKSLIIGDLLDSIIFINETGDTIEAEEVPVWIDCIYIPAGANQLKQLLPQINFYNLNTVYLGGDGWGSSSVYKLGDRITKDCYFSSAVLEETRGEMVEQFAAEFDLRYGKQPGRLEALGYDAMSLICLALHADSYARNEIKNFLANIKDYRGVAGNVTFGEHRENIELPVYTIKEGVPIRVEIE
jgi:branched-chain amino acid transport system substrate-binding protein